jgi:hypothetical protein
VRHVVTGSPRPWPRCCSTTQQQSVSSTAEATICCAYSEAKVCLMLTTDRDFRQVVTVSRCRHAQAQGHAPGGWDPHPRCLPLVVTGNGDGGHIRVGVGATREWGSQGGKQIAGYVHTFNVCYPNGMHALWMMQLVAHQLHHPCVPSQRHACTSLG